MYSVKNLITENAIKAFETVANIGYKNWELCQLYGREDIAWNYGLQMSPKDAKAFLSEHGIKAIGAHLTEEQILNEDYLKECFAYMQDIGCTAIGLGATIFPYMDTEAIKNKCVHWNSVAALAKDYGIRFYYHNHFMEFQYFGNKMVYEYLMEYTDPGLVFFELDTYWALRGAQNPIEIIREYGYRIWALHQKDFPKNFRSPVNLFEYKIDGNMPITKESFRTINEPDAFTEIGTGIIDIQSIIDEANKKKIEYLILEQDRTALGEIQSIEISMANLKNYSGIEY